MKGKAMKKTRAPLSDYSLWNREDLGNENLFPVCDICGDRIVSETYYTAGGMIICHDCLKEPSTEDYVERAKGEI